MSDCEPLLLQLAASVMLTTAQRKRAEGSHAYFRSLLRTGQMDRRIETTFLSGSFYRHTEIRPLEDVDVIVVIRPEEWNISWGWALPRPAQVISTFYNAIHYRYPNSSARKQRRSVRLIMNRLAIDAVPAVRVSSDDGALLKIPDSEKDDWILTAPDRHRDAATAINRDTGMRFKPLVRLLKWWNREGPATARTKSFAIETLAVHLFQANKLSSLTDGLLNFFDWVAHFDNASNRMWNDHGVRLGHIQGALFGYVVPDAAGTGSNTVGGMDGDRRGRFISHAMRARDRLLEAQAARSSAIAEQRVRDALHL